MSVSPLPVLGKTLTAIDRDVDGLTFRCTDGTVYRMWHDQECCEYVYLEDVCGDLDDLIGSPLVEAEEDFEEASAKGGTWTFYRFSTVKGTVTLRWLGESNGYYSEQANFDEVRP